MSALIRRWHNWRLLRWHMRHGYRPGDHQEAVYRAAALRERP